MRALLILVFLISGFAHAKSNSADGIDKSADFQSTIQAVGSLTYMDALPGLRSMAGSDEKTLADLNSAYKALKAKGQENPLVKDVMAKYRESHALPQTALIGTCIAVVLAATYAGGYLIIRGNPKLLRIVQNPGGSSSDCKDQASRVIESAHPKKEAVAVTGQSAT